MRQPVHRLYNGESLYISGMVGVAEVKGDEIERIYLYLPLPINRSSADQMHVGYMMNKLRS